MRPSSRAWLLWIVAASQLCPLGVETVFSESQEKAPEKSSSRPQPPQAAPDLPSVPPHPSGEPKPPPQTGPPAKTDVVPDREGKEKETAKKPVGSLILTVKLALLADTRLVHAEVDVEEDHHTITLAGRVSSEEEKAAAAEVARSVPGIKAVVTTLVVDKGLALALAKKQDESITALIKERFAKSATLKTANFEVKTEAGIVSISGAVRFQVIALEAAEAARQVPGVRAVTTENIRVEGEG